MAGHKIVSWRIYVANFSVLTVLMIATVWVAAYDFGGLNLAFALGISITKATLIVLIFMNVKYGSRLTWLFAAGGFAWFLILIGFILTDFVFVDLGSPYTTPLP